jgi:hypothetical protein
VIKVAAASKESEAGAHRAVVRPTVGGVARIVVIIVIAVGHTAEGRNWGVISRGRCHRIASCYGAADWVINDAGRK